MILVSDQYRFVLVTIPKNANVTLKNWFDSLEQGTLDAFEREPRSTFDLRKDVYSRRPVQDDYLKFAVIRNPWLRVASAYLTKIVGLVKWRGAKRFLTELELKDFAQFVSFLRLRDMTSRWCNPHWRAQYTFFDSLEIDELLKVESLQKDFDRMCDRIGVRRIRLPNWKANPDRKAKYRGLYSEEEARIIGKLYRRDVELGNYSCPDYCIDPGKSYVPPGLAFILRARYYMWSQMMKDYARRARKRLRSAAG